MRALLANIVNEYNGTLNIWLFAIIFNFIMSHSKSQFYSDATLLYLHTKWVTSWKKELTMKKKCVVFFGRLQVQQGQMSYSLVGPKAAKTR